MSRLTRRWKCKECGRKYKTRRTAARSVVAGSSRAHIAVREANRNRYIPDLNSHCSMSWERIRPVALGLPFRENGEILVARHYDEVAEMEFYRPLGGGLEFGEHSDAGVRREFQEELGTDVAVEERIAAFENVFEFRGEAGHEVVFLYRVAFEDDAYYEQDAFEAVEGNGEVFPVRWKPLSDFTGDDADVLYPDGIQDALTSDYYR